MTHISEIWDAKICILWMNNYGENKMINIYIINEFHLYIIYKTKKQCYESLVSKKIPRKKMSKKTFNFFAVQKKIVKSYHEYEIKFFPYPNTYLITNLNFKNIVMSHKKKSKNNCRIKTISIFFPIPKKKNVKSYQG